MPSASAAPLDVLRRCARTDAGGAIGRDTGEGQYPWDLMPDSIMTNATVGKVDQAPQRPVLHGKRSTQRSLYRNSHTP